MWVGGSTGTERVGGAAAVVLLLVGPHLPAISLGRALWWEVGLVEAKGRSKAAS